MTTRRNARSRDKHESPGIDSTADTEVESRTAPGGVDFSTLGVGGVPRDFGRLSGAASLASEVLSHRRVAGDPMRAISAQLGSDVLGRQTFNEDALRTANALAGSFNPLTSRFESLVKSAMFRQFQVADLITPSALRSFEVAATARIAQTTGSNAFSIWRQSMHTEQSISALVVAAGPQIDLSGSVRVADVLRLSGVTTSSAETSARLPVGNVLGTSFSRRPIAQLRRYAEVLPSTASSCQLSALARASQGIAGIVGTELASLNARDDHRFDEAVERMTLESSPLGETDRAKPGRRCCSGLVTSTPLCPNCCTGRGMTYTAVGPPQT